MTTGLRLVRYHPSSPVDLTESNMLSWPARLTAAKTVEQLKQELRLWQCAQGGASLLLVLMQVNGEQAWIDVTQLPDKALPTGTLHVRRVQL
jgi:hypothetical protein